LAASGIVGVGAGDELLVAPWFAAVVLPGAGELAVVGASGVALLPELPPQPVATAATTASAAPAVSL
jgi:hypothetical protein